MVVCLGIERTWRVVVGGVWGLALPGVGEGEGLWWKVKVMVMRFAPRERGG